MAIAVLTNGSIGLNTSSSVSLPVAKNRYLFAISVGCNTSGGGDPGIHPMYATYNGISLTSMLQYAGGSFADGGYVKINGMVIPDTWTNASYTMTTTSAGTGGLRWFFLSGVNPFQPTATPGIVALNTVTAPYSQRLAENVTDISTKSGGLVIVAMGTEEGLGYPWSVTGTTTIESPTGYSFLGYISTGGGSYRPTIVPNIDTNGLVATISMNPVMGSGMTIGSSFF